MDKEEIAIYKVDYQYRSRCSLAFDRIHATAYVEAPAKAWAWDLRKMFESKFGIVNSFEKINVVQL